MICRLAKIKVSDKNNSVEFVTVIRSKQGTFNETTFKLKPVVTVVKIYLPGKQLNDAILLWACSWLSFSSLGVGPPTPWLVPLPKLEPHLRQNHALISALLIAPIWTSSCSSGRSAGQKRGGGGDVIHRKTQMTVLKWPVYRFQKKGEVL